jgi:hypothetical protein
MKRSSLNTDFYRTPHPSPPQVTYNSSTRRHSLWDLHPPLSRTGAGDSNPPPPPPDVGGSSFQTPAGRRVPGVQTPAGSRCEGADVKGERQGEGAKARRTAASLRRRWEEEDPSPCASQVRARPCEPTNPTTHRPCEPTTPTIERTTRSQTTYTTARPCSRSTPPLMDPVCERVDHQVVIAHDSTDAALVGLVVPAQGILRARPLTGGAEGGGGGAFTLRVQAAVAIEATRRPALHTKGANGVTS